MLFDIFAFLPLTDRSYSSTGYFCRSCSRLLRHFHFRFFVLLVRSITLSVNITYYYVACCVDLNVVQFCKEFSGIPAFV